MPNTPIATPACYLVDQELLGQKSRSNPGSNPGALIIIGQKCAGKTTLVTQASSRMGSEWIDTDTELLKGAYEGESIREFYARVGEPYFREMELDLIKKAAKRPLIISTGGGAIISPASALFLASQPWVLFWSTAHEICVDRILASNGAFYLGSCDPEQWRLVMAKREPLYEKVARYRASTQEEFDAVFLQWRDLWAMSGLISSQLNQQIGKGEDSAGRLEKIERN